MVQVLVVSKPELSPTLVKCKGFEFCRFVCIVDVHACKEVYMCVSVCT